MSKKVVKKKDDKIKVYDISGEINIECTTVISNVKNDICTSSGINVVLMEGKKNKTRLFRLNENQLKQLYSWLVM
ncbi:MAG: hypothetical protein WC516_06870 [Patescibacteria group bacterium]